MKIQAISDTHGFLPEIPACDLLLLAGDVTPYKDHSREVQEYFLRGPFREWLLGIPAEEIVWIAGNHDFILEGEEGQRLAHELPGNFLLDSEIEIGGLRIWGTPWIPEMPAPWAFQLSEAKLEEKWKQIPEGIDILLSHSAPHGLSDRISDGREVGSPSLRKNLKKTSYTVCGHVHEGRGYYRHETGELWNVSYIDKNYEVVGLPPMIEIEPTI